jgi:alpha-L-fucosidase 2
MKINCVNMAALVVLITVSSTASQAAEHGYKLAFDKPANTWTEAVPVGNGRIGAMVFGGTEHERLQINESTLWGGAPHDYINPDAYSHLDEVRKLISAGRVDDAEKLSEKMLGSPKLLLPYQLFCDMRLHFPGHAQATQYHRELNLDDAVAETTYTIKNTNFGREVFVSYPDQVLVVRITAGQPGQLTFMVGMDSPQAGTQVEIAGSDTLH